MQLFLRSQPVAGALPGQWRHPMRFPHLRNGRSGGRILRPLSAMLHSRHKLNRGVASRSWRRNGLIPASNTQGRQLLNWAGMSWPTTYAERCAAAGDGERFADVS